MNSIKIVFGMVLMAALFNACQKDEQAVPSVPERSVSYFHLANGGAPDDNGLDQYDDDDEEYDDYECFSFVFPLTVVLPDGTTQIIDAETDLEALIDQWFEENPNAEDFPTLQFPIKVILEDDPTTEVTINNEEELCNLFFECEDWEDWEENFCYEIVFPVDVALPDGTVSSAQDEGQLYDIVEAWFEANEDSEEYPDFVYPIQVLDEEGSPVTVSSSEELDDFEEDCYDDYFEDCFSINYPYQISLPSGEVLTVNNEDEEDELLDQWFEDHPEVEGDPELVYPISITLEDGTVKKIGTAEELDTELEMCFGDDDISAEGVVTGGSKTVLTKTTMLVKRG